MHLKKASYSDQIIVSILQYQSANAVKQNLSVLKTQFVRPAPNVVGFWYASAETATHPVTTIKNAWKVRQIQKRFKIRFIFLHCHDNLYSFTNRKIIRFYGSTVKILVRSRLLAKNFILMDIHLLNHRDLLLFLKSYNVRSVAKNFNSF